MNDAPVVERQESEAPLSYAHFWRKFQELGPGFRRWIIPGVIRWFLRSHHFSSRDIAFLGKGVRIIKRGKNAQIILGRGCRIADHCELQVGGEGVLSIGTRTVVGNYSRLMAATQVRIGARCMISWNCSIFDSTGHRMWLQGQEEAEIEAPVTIGDDVWMGPYSIVMKGVTIGNNCIVGAGSVVRRDVPPNSLVYGNPARFAGRVERWER